MKLQIGNDKYEIKLSNKKTKKLDVFKNGEYHLSFGSKIHQHYYDMSGLLPKSQNHLDIDRRKNYYARHKDSDDPDSAKFWSHIMLWPKDDKQVAKMICGNIPKRYYANLNDLDKIKQCNSINKNEERPKLETAKVKKGSWTQKFKKKYGDISLADLKSVSKATGIKKSILDKVFKRGVAAYYSSGSRPNMSANQWGYGRVASFVMGNMSHDNDLR